MYFYYYPASFRVSLEEMRRRWWRFVNKTWVVVNLVSVYKAPPRIIHPMRICHERVYPRIVSRRNNRNP